MGYKPLDTMSVPERPVKRKAAIERQVIVTWFRPAEKLPEEDMAVVATISGVAGSTEFHHALALIFWSKSDGWYSTDYSFDSLIVHAWCDLEPYQGNTEMQCLGE